MTNNLRRTRTYRYRGIPTYYPVHYSPFSNLSIRGSFYFLEFYVKHDKSNLDLFYLFGIIFIYTHFNLLFIPLPFLLRPGPGFLRKMSAFGQLQRPLFNNTHLYNIIYGSGHTSSGPKSKSHR